MKKQIIITVMALFVCNISIAQTKSEKRQLKKEQKLLKVKANYSKIKTLIESNNFDFEGTWVNPLGGTRRSLVTNPNRLRIIKNNADGNLPFFGVMHQSGYTNNVGIEFNNQMEDYKISFNDESQRISISFLVKNKSERFKISIDITSNGGAKVIVSSNKRNTISYDGIIKAIQL